MVWELGVVNGNDVRAVRRLDDAEHEKYTKAVVNLQQFASDRQSYIILKLNYEDYEKLIKHYSEDKFLRNAIGYWTEAHQTTYRMILEINRRILSYLSAFHICLGYTEKTLKNRYGKNSDMVRRFDEVRCKAYDTCLAYRFVYELRNYSLHCALPLGHLSMKSKETEPYSGKIINTLEVRILRDKLLEDDYWHKNLKLRHLATEIGDLPSEFEIDPFLLEAMRCLDGIDGTTIEGELSELKESALYLQQLTQPLGETSGVPCLMNVDNIKQSSEGKIASIGMNVSWIPMHLVDLVMKIQAVSKR